MLPGERFEIECYNYLIKKYGNHFRHEGNMDSTKSDIAVIKNGNPVFYIEVKDTTAQSGQFVLLPNEKEKTFDFSPRNKSESNCITKAIIDYMNKDFQSYFNAGTAGKPIDLDSKIFTDWIVNHYISKKVKYVISFKDDFVILPIQKFGEYFSVSATYRIKKSGSSKLAKKDFTNAQMIILNKYKTSKFNIEDSSLFVNINERVSVKSFEFGKYTLYLSEIGTNQYMVRKLSNTRNMNVIFSIKLKRYQDKVDLTGFEKNIEKYCK